MNHRIENRVSRSLEEKWQLKSELWKKVIILGLSLYGNPCPDWD
jgi:hypothetical protein